MFGGRFKDLIKSIRSRTVAARDPSTENRRGGQRYAPCSVLSNAGIANVVWLEDALAVYGHATALWDLHVLVKDVETVKNVLASHGYLPASASTHYQCDPEIAEKGVRMSYPARSSSQSDSGLSSSLPDMKHDNSVCVVLLSASEWHYEIAENGNLVEGQVPPLSKFLDAMMTFWLHISSFVYSERLLFALHIGTLIGYCYTLEEEVEGKTIAVRSVEYAARLKPENRELHYDILGPHKERFYLWTGEAAHRYHARVSQDILIGTFVPKPRSDKGFQTSMGRVTETENE